MFLGPVDQEFTHLKSHPQSRLQEGGGLCPEQVGWVLSPLGRPPCLRPRPRAWRGKGCCCGDHRTQAATGTPGWGIQVVEWGKNVPSHDVVLGV